MKVLLFVQNDWNKRPPRAQWCVPMEVSWDALVAWIREGSFCPTIATASAVRAARRADRWWLVECENAKAGRHCISGGCEPYRCHRADGPMSCRILASGGKQ